MAKKEKYELNEFVEQIYSLVDEMPYEMRLIIKNSSGSTTLRIAKMALNAIGIPPMLLSDQECYEDLISITFGALIEKAYCPRIARNNFENNLKNINEMTFREFDCKFLYIRCPVLLEQMDIENCNDDGVIAFAYLDYQAGISLDIIGTAHISNNNIFISKADKSYRRVIRREVFDRTPMVKVLDLIDTDVNLDDFYYEVGAHEIYYRDINDEIELLRNNTDLDASRHQFFPDDIQIQLVKDGQIAETLWARCSRINSDTGFMYAKLLNEPQKKFGFHMGDEIPFRTIESDDGKLLCVNLEYYNHKFL